MSATKISSIYSRIDFFHKVLYDFEVKNLVSSNKRIKLSDVQVVSIMSWLFVNSFVFSLDWKIHFNFNFVLKLFRCSKGDVWYVFCWQLYEMNPKNYRRKNLGNKVTENWHGRYGEWIGIWQQWLVIFSFCFYSVLRWWNFWFPLWPISNAALIF